MDSTTIAYLGPATTYSHHAAIKLFGKSNIQYKSYPSITKTIEAVKLGLVNYAVVPYENTINGIIEETTEAMKQSNLIKIKDITMEIQHYLLSYNTIGKIKKVYSKKEVFEQCSEWLLDNMPNVMLIPTNSTVQGILKMKEDLNHESSVISSSLSGLMFQIPVIAHNIQNKKNNNTTNKTRFIVIT